MTRAKYRDYPGAASAAPACDKISVLRFLLAAEFAYAVFIYVHIGLYFLLYIERISALIIFT